MSLQTGNKIHRNNWKSLPFNEEVIKRVEELVETDEEDIVITDGNGKVIDDWEQPPDEVEYDEEEASISISDENRDLLDLLDDENKNQGNENVNEKNQSEDGSLVENLEGDLNDMKENLNNVIEEINEIIENIDQGIDNTEKNFKNDIDEDPDVISETESIKTKKKKIKTKTIT